MEVIEVATGLVALIFAASSALLLVLLLRERRRIKAAPAPQPTLSAEDLLHDLLTRGQAILRVEVIDPANLLLRSPRR